MARPSLASQSTRRFPRRSGVGEPQEVWWAFTSVQIRKGAGREESMEERSEISVSVGS